MTADVTRRCGCRDENGRQFGAACPRLAADPKHGTWQYSISAGFVMKPGSDGRLRRVRQQVRKGGYATQKAAQTARNQAAVSLDQGTWIKPSKETVAAFMVDWLERRRTTGSGLKTSTYTAYKRYLEQDIVTAPLAAVKLADVRRHDIDAFLASLTAAGRGATTVHRIAAVLQGAFKDATHGGLIQVDPSRQLALPKVVAREVEYWQPDEIGRFLDFVAPHRLSALFEVAIWTGMRRGELAGLHWPDVDLARRTVTVTTTRLATPLGVVEDTPKTRAGRRTIPLSDAAVGALVAWQIVQDTERRAWGDGYSNDGWVFTYEDGRPIRPDYATKLFDKLRDRAGLPHMKFHGLRHCAVALHSQSGTSLAVVSKMIGHSSIAITQDLYGYMFTDAARDAVNATAALVPRTSAHTLPSQPVETAV